MLLADEPNIREVIAFPMNQKAEDLLMSAPCEVELRQLRDLHSSKLPKRSEERSSRAENEKTLDQCFATLKRNRKAFIAYLSAGDPDLSSTIDIVLRLEDQGVDVLSLACLFQIRLQMAE